MSSPTPDKTISPIPVSSEPARCANCRFFMPSPIDGQPSYCRRYPPESFVIQVHRDEKGAVVGNESMSLMPITNAANWCGEHQPRLN